MIFGNRIKYLERKAFFKGYFTFIDLIKETNNPPPKTWVCEKLEIHPRLHFIYAYAEASA